MIGTIREWHLHRESGIIEADGGSELFFWASEVIAECAVGARVRFQVRTVEGRQTAVGVKVLPYSEHERIEPIRLAGRRVVTIEGLGESSFVAPLPETIDLGAVLSAAGLKADEREYLNAASVDRIPRRLLPQALGMEPRQVEAVRMRTQRRLKQFRKSHPRRNGFMTLGRGDSLHLSYAEVCVPGSHALTWALQPLGPEFQEVMADARRPPKAKRSRRSKAA